MKTFKISLELVAWLVLLGSAPLHATPPPASAYIQDIAIHPHRSEIVYAATRGAGLYKSANGGALWKPVNQAAGVAQSSVIVVDASMPNRVYSGGNESGVWMSEDDGANWRLIGLERVTICDLVIDPADSNRIFVLAPEGLYRANLATGDWGLVFDYRAFLETNWKGSHPSEFWEYTRFQKIAINPHDSDTILIGARWEGGYHRSDDGGESWRHEDVSGLFRRVDAALFDPSEPGIIYAGTHHQGMFKSYNDGRSWVSISRGLAPQIRTPHYGAYLISGFVFEPGDSQTIYAGSDHSNWKSTDGGASWRELDRTLTCEFARSFAVDSNQPQTVYAGTNVGMYKSTDGGESWVSINRGFPERIVKQAMELTIDDEDFEYAIVEGRPAVFRRSITRGTDWKSMSWLLYTNVESMAYDESAGEIVLQTTDGEVRSADCGFRWSVPKVEFSPIASLSVEAPFSSAPSPNLRTIEVAIEGNVFFEDSLVNPLYQRPPYVSLQLVRPGYPCDGSEPVWSGNWNRFLKGTIQIPRAVLEQGEEYLLYVEARDFQRNTVIGYASVAPGQEVARVQVRQGSLLPCLQQ